MDLDNQAVECHTAIPELGNKSFTIHYDKLVIALGATSNTFGLEGVSENCFFLKGR